MKQSSKAVLFTATISTICDIVLQQDVVDMDELMDVLDILGLNANTIAELPPILAIHAVCKAFAEMDLTDEILAEIQRGEA